MRKTLHALLGVISVGLKLPAVLLLVWGGFYVADCVQALTAPGVPVEYRYNSELGEMLVVADSYQFDIETMQGFVQRVRVIAPDGSEVASTDMIDILFDGNVAVMRLNDPRIRVRRLEDGRFDVFDMLPVREEEEITGGAFRLVANNAVIEYSDANVDAAPITLTLTDVGVDGAAGTFLFKSALAFDGVSGRIGGSFEDDGRLIADVSVQEGDVAPLLGYLRPFLSYEAFDEYAYLDADSLVVDGSARVWSHPESGTDITGNMTIEGRGITTPRTLRNATLSASVSDHGRGVFVDGTASQPGLTADFVGTVLFGEEFRMTGDLTATSTNRGTLPALLADFVDPTLEYRNARYEGKVDTTGEEFLFVGDLSADEASYGGETTTDVLAHVRLHHEGIVARFERGTWAGVDYAGAVSVDFESGQLSGGVETERGRLEPLAEHFGTDKLKGIVAISAVIGGTVEAPFAELYARGSGGVQLTDGPLTSIGVFEARGRLDNEGFFLQRLTSSSQNGAFAAEGSMRWSDGSLALTVSGGGLDLSSFSDDMRGIGFVKANIAGTRDAPEAAGRVEVYGFEAFGRKVPQIVMDWQADDDRLFVERFAARAGTGQIDGTATVRWDDRTLDGAFTGQHVRLEEWVAPITVGSVMVSDGNISGTLDDPLVTAELAAGPVYVGSVEFESARMQLVGRKDGVEAPTFVATIDGGEISGQGAFSFDTSSGSATAALTNLPLSKVPVSDASLSLGGRASGELQLSFDETGPTSGSLLLDRIVDLDVNGTVVGQGSLDATLEGGNVVANAQVGSLERYIDLVDASYNLDTREVGGQLIVYNVLIEDVVEGSLKAMATWPEGLRDLFESSTGLLNAAITVAGPIENPSIDVESLMLTELEVRGRDAGVFRASGARRDGVWTIHPQTEGPMWALGDTKFFLSGSVTEEGSLSVNADLTNFRAEWLRTLFPQVPLMAGVAEVHIQADGTLSDPRAHATLNVKDVGYYEGEKAVVLPIEVDIDSIDIEDEVVAASGSVFYKGLQGLISGTVPFSSFSTGEGARPMDVTLTFPEQTFDNIAPHIALIDAERSEGVVRGSASIQGVWGALATSAMFQLDGESLALEEHGTFFRDVSAVAEWANGTLSVNGSFKGEEQGSGSVDLRAAFPDFFAEDVDIATINQVTTVRGDIVLSDYRLEFLLPNAESASGATITTQDLKIGGVLAAPSVSGNVSLSEVYVRLPDELTGTESPVIFRVDPAFEGVTVNVAPGARLVTDIARIEFFGAGRLDGSLQNPDVSLPLTVTGGRFDMPTARIRLEEGGSIIVGYRSALGSSPTARVDLNLEGHTTISARRASNEYETYQIQLLIRGNLLDEEGLNIVASSDPPDLSSEQIMAVLGRKELIENFARGGSDDYLRETLYSVGLPTASNILTSGLAQQLGLDYISVDYNPFDQTVVGVGKTIGKGLMLQASRQLNANPGEELKYEVQLTYRLPMEDAFFSRVRLSLGFDEQVPWRVKLNWARRF